MATKYPIQEIPFEKMTEESFDCAEPTIYAVLKEGVRFEFLVKRERERERGARQSSGREILRSPGRIGLTIPVTAG